MFRTALIIVLLTLLPPAPAAHAQALPTAPGSVFMEEAPQLYEMFEAMGLYEILEIMAMEHANGADAVAASLFPGQGGADWQAQIARMHTHERMVALFEGNFPQTALTDAQIAEITEFMRSETGQRLIAGEIAARRAFLEEEAVEAGAAALLAAMETNDARLDTLRAFNAVNGLIDRNVSGALNARFAFFRGLVDGGAFEDDMAEDIMLANVWSQEPEIRQTTVEWLFSFQVTAYSDVENADLQAYVVHSETEAGQAIIAALFQAFDIMLEDLSYEIGYAAAAFVAGEET